MAERASIASGDIIQVVPTHKWGGALLIVDDPKPWGVTAYLTIPRNDGAGANAFIRLAHDEYEPVGAKAIFRRERADG